MYTLSLFTATMLLSTISLSQPVWGKSGKASYNSNSDGGAGKCSLPGGVYKKWTSVGPPSYANAQMCGACLKVTDAASKKETIVHVVDQCHGCGEGDLNISLEAWNDISNTTSGSIDVTWDQVRCPDIAGNIQYQWSPNSNPSWAEVQLRNHAQPVSKLEYSSTTENWQEATRRDDNYFIIKGLEEPVVNFKVTDAKGATLSDTGIKIVSEGGMVEGKDQFK